MASTAPHIEFAPPRTRGSLRALGLAILAHGVLLAVLSVGVQWKSEPLQQTFEAELWSSVPVQAAAPAALPPPDPQAAKPQPPEVTPKPAPRVEVAQKADAQIALAKELKEKKLALEMQAQEDKKRALQEKKRAELVRQKDQLKKEQADQQARAKEEERRQDLKDAQQLAEQRQKAIKRMEGLAGAGGNAASTSSTALEARALSTSYQGRIRAYIKRFHTYTETVHGNPVTELEIRTASDGSILSRKVTKPSGTKSWDEAALNAIDKAERLPLDESGRSPSPVTIIWSAQEVAR
jgi:colicin import membrane protein